MARPHRRAASWYPGATVGPPAVSSPARALGTRRRRRPTVPTAAAVPQDSPRRRRRARAAIVLAVLLVARPRRRGTRPGAGCSRRTQAWQDSTQRVGDARALDAASELAIRRPTSPRRRRSSTRRPRSSPPRRSGSPQLADEKAQLGDTSASQQQLADYQSRVSQAAGQVATALASCVDGQQRLIGYLQESDQYDQADLAQFATDVQTVCARGDRRQHGTAARAEAMSRRTGPLVAVAVVLLAGGRLQRAARHARRRCRRTSSPPTCPSRRRRRAGTCPPTASTRPSGWRCGSATSAAAPCRPAPGSRSTTTPLVTNKHVVADSSTLQLSTYDGRDIAAARGQHGGPGRPGDRAHRRRAAGRPRARRRPTPPIGDAGHRRRVPARARAHRDHRAGARPPDRPAQREPRRRPGHRRTRRARAAPGRPCSTATAGWSGSSTRRTRTGTALWCP